MKNYKVCRNTHTDMDQERRYRMSARAGRKRDFPGLSRESGSDRQNGVREAVVKLGAGCRLSLSPVSPLTNPQRQFV